MATLKRNGGSETFETYGPTVLPQLPYIEKGLDFQVTQMSDSIVISAEHSPAGLINFFSYCFKVTLSLLIRKNTLVRGYITRGRIYHHGNVFFGTGYHDACDGEKTVKLAGNELEGAPFVQIGPSVLEDLRAQNCKVFERTWKDMVYGEKDCVVLAPLNRICDLFTSNADVTKIEELERFLGNISAQLQKPPPDKEKAIRQHKLYQEVLTRWQHKCGKLREDLKNMQEPFPSGRFTPELFPGLFDKG